MMHPRERFRLLVEVREDDVPAAITLKRFLKAALRVWGIRAIKFEPLTPADEAPGVAQDAADAKTTHGPL